LALGALACALLLSACGASTSPELAGDAKHGEYLFAAADCGGCHTVDKPGSQLGAGGLAMKTDFGTFYTPNITPDKAGLGTWSYQQFHRAMREGKGASGEYLYPAFPYTSFTGMTDQDIADIWAYLKTLPASSQASKPHALKAPFGFRPILIGWRTLYLHKGPLKPASGHDAQWNRGRYLAETVAHCQECHSPRTPLGGLDTNQLYAGNPNGPDNQDAPNISSDPKDGIGKLAAADLKEMLTSGAKPDGDYLGGGMALVVNGTGKLSEADRDALVAYIKGLPAKASPPKPAKKKPAPAPAS
jgi:mono/diheme cytochrome c family protein